MQADAIEALGRDAERLGILLDAAMLAEFSTLLELVLQAAAHVNLTSLTDRDAIIRRHFVESLAFGRQLDQRHLLQDTAHVLDLGSGAGFPGLPLKIAWPGIDIALLEATGKKARFLEHAVSALDLRETAVLQGRAEVAAHEIGLRGAFGLVVARSVASLPVLIELALPFLRLGGTLAALKGSRAANEVQDSGVALELCGGQVLEHLPRIDGADLELLLIQKVLETPDQYPRRPGVPAKRPLGR